MRFKVLLFLTAALAFSVGLAVLPGRIEARETDGQLAGCVGMCFKCSFAGDKYQVAEAQWWEEANDVDWIVACGSHVKCEDDCNETFAQTTLELSRHVAIKDIDGFAKLLARAPSIEVNLRRKAVQVIGCNNTVVASIPINDQLLAAAASYTARVLTHVE